MERSIRRAGPTSSSSPFLSLSSDAHGLLVSISRQGSSSSASRQLYREGRFTAEGRLMVSAALWLLLILVPCKSLLAISMG